VPEKIFLDAKRDMIRKICDSINLDILKAKLSKAYKTDCNKSIKFISGDIVVHDGVPAVQLDFSCQDRFSVIIDLCGRLLSILETPDEFIGKDFCEIKRRKNSLAEKIAGMMAEINR